MDGQTLIASGSTHSFTVSPEKAGIRLDAFLVEQFSGYSRSFFSRVIDDRLVSINGEVAKKNGFMLKAGMVVSVTFPIIEKDVPRNAAALQEKGLSVIHHEPSFAIIYKPAGITVHPVSEHSTEPTLVDWLLTTFSEVGNVGYKDRPGIVHRLDKETSGLMIVPLTAPAFTTFSTLFRDRQIHKTYLALVHGHPEQEGTINYAIGRHQTIRNRMTHVTEGRAARTHFSVLSYLPQHTLVEAHPVTGRTHQIRVHFTTLGHPLIGDKLYGTTSPLIDRHALHASRLQFAFEGRSYDFHMPLPEDMKELLEKIS